MKKYLYIIVVFLVALSCERVDEESLAGPDSELVHKVFTAEIYGNDVDTKLVLENSAVDGIRYLVWEPGDEIGIATNGTYYKFTNIDEESSACGNFEGSINQADMYYAVYPYRQNMVMTAEQTINLPSVQTYREGSFDKGMAPMVGRANDGETITFMNLCGVLSLSITGTEVIKSISFTAKDESGNNSIVCGDCTINMNYTTFPELSTTSTGGTILTLDCGEGVQLDAAEPTLFHLVLPPATYHGFSVVIATADGKFMEKSTDKQLTVGRSALTKAGTFGFEENLVPVNLSETGTSNCYIVPDAGLYSFDATVIGDGFGIIPDSDFHTDDPHIDPASAELLWEESESVVTCVNYNDGYISFLSNGIKGNALIAAKDADGQIIWSWHIWNTDLPKEETYVNSTGTYQVLDRNLGATRADRGTGEQWKESIGVLYQWGRKDPFSQGHYTSGRTFTYYSESVPNPTLFENSWYNINSNMWSLDVKTIYDPCPIGYRAATASAFRDISNTNIHEANADGWYLSHNDVISWFPKSNIIDGGTFSSLTYSELLLSNDVQNYAYTFLASSSEIKLHNTHHHKNTALPVRCMKDTNKLPEATLTEITDITNASATVKGVITDDGYETPVSLRGVVYGSTADVTNDSGVVVECGSGDGQFTAILDGLQASSKYYVRAFAITDEATVYSPAMMLQTPDETGVINLSQHGTANSYIISRAGTYSFDCSVKGNSNESLRSPSEVAVVWETFNTQDAVTIGSIIASAELDGNTVRFTTPEIFTPGNALIAVKDTYGIIWSWHIWATDLDTDVDTQLYLSGAIMMDRNLGALNTVPGDVRSFGLFYQWGRKDPFVGSATLINGSFAVTAPTDAKLYVNKDAVNNSLDYAIANPSKVITGSTWNADNTLWSSVKTAYDPCPPGWRVPDVNSGVWDGFSISSTNHGVYFNAPMSSPSAYYPFTGYTGGNANLSNVDAVTYLWTCDYNSRSFYIQKKSVQFTNMGIAGEHPVRCMKDAAFAINTGAAETISDRYVIMSGTLTISDGTNMDEVGFICSESNSSPRLNSTDVDSFIISKEDNVNGEFTSTLSGLKPYTVYYVRAYAKGGHNVKYGDVVSFTTKQAANSEGYVEGEFEW